MKVSGLKINGITDPVGFSFDRILCSWKVTDTSAKRQQRVRIQISATEDFSGILYEKEGSELCSNETKLDFFPEPCTRYYWRVTVTADNGETASSKPAFFETGKMNQPWTARWIGASREDTFHPVLTKQFSIGKRIKKARLYICGLGLYEAYVNGKKAGNKYLAPFLNDYEACYQYQTYDVTRLLKDFAAGEKKCENQELEEENTIEILLGKGWYMGTFGLKNQSCLFGDEMKAIAELHVDYEDGSQEVIGTDESWKYRGSDIEDSGIYMGEIYNHSLWEKRENPWKKVEIKTAPGRLTERYSLPVVAKEELHPKEIIHTPAGETVVDFGQNHAGFMEFEADFPKGTRIVIECGEVLQNGNFYHDNYRDAKAEFVYVSDGRKEKVRPHFTYFGYRYLKISGWPFEVTRTSIVSKVIYSDMERTGYFVTSNPKINRLYENCLWGMKSNFIDLPTDCPQRSERLGWTGDAQVFAPTASYHMDTRAFYRKFLKDLHSEQQRADGAIPNYIPSKGDFGTASVWGDAGTFIPALLYRDFGSLEELREFYPMMREWVDYMHRVDIRNGETGFFRNGFQFGDWLALDGPTEQSFKGSTDDDYIGTVYYYQSVSLTAQAARELGYEEEAEKYEKLAGKIRNAVLDEYFTATGRFALDTQASYIIALKFGLYRDKERLIRQFQERLKKDAYKIRCGFVGAPLLCMTLGENKMEKLAYDFIFQEEFPSWLYCVNLGATTIWERWNSLLPDGSISGTGMNSLNHYAYGSVVEFFYAYIAGIRPAEPGYKKAIIAPVPDMRLHFCKCCYHSACGNYVSEWKIDNNGIFHLHVEIPFGCEAQVQLPRSGGRKEQLFAGSYDFSYQPDQDFRKIYDENTRLSQIAKDSEVLDILKEDLPAAYQMVMSRNPEHMERSLNELKDLFFMGITPEAADKAIKKISSLERWEI